MEIKWDYIEREMKNKKITNKKMAEILNVSVMTFNRYKNGSTDIPLKIFNKLLYVLDLEFNKTIKKSNLENYKMFVAFAGEEIAHDRIEKISKDIKRHIENDTLYAFIEKIQRIYGRDILNVIEGYKEHRALQEILDKD